MPLGVLPRTLVVCLAAGLVAAAQDQAEYFEKKIRPIFATSCAGCHNAKVKTAGLDLSSGEGFLAGGVSGPIVNKENPAESALLKVTSYDERLKMPPQGKLSAEKLADLAEWVKSGAAWPGAQAAAAVASGAGKMETRKGGRNFTEAEKKFWSFQPVVKPAPPATKLTGWAHGAIDQFILAGLEAKGLKPAEPAGKTTLLRRVTFDLTGLPPTPKEIADFLADETPGAFAKVVDRLLESPRYGERWGRHWLDVARYADSTGNDEDHRYPYAWRYRDYVIDSFNRDVPYDQFVREQLAGDLIPSPGGSPINRRGLVATGFLALGAKAIAQQDKKKMLYDVYDEQLDVTSKALLGLTLSCSRCHDHKFDPLLQRDYYSMINFFANTRSFKDSESHVSKLLYLPLVPQDEYRKYQAYLDRVTAKKMELEDVVEGEKERYAKELTPRLADYMLAAKAVRDGSAKPESVARDRQLDAEILDKWVKYLAFDWRQKPHLEAWSKAAPDTLAAVARKYQEGYAAQLAAWDKKIARWREETRRMLKEMNMPPRPRPEFNAEEDGFFFDVYFGRGPFAISEKDLDKRFSAEAKASIARIRQEQEELKKSAPSEPDMACGVEETGAKDAVQQRVFIRGDYAALGEEAPKAYPLILARSGDPQLAAGATGSGRLALADWVTGKDNPLTARVMANRIWQRHFGEGIVRTPDNFGKMGERPTHPELLDYLAARFMENGWSIKKLHREILLSAAYRMSSTASPEAIGKDPENKLFSRFQRRRLDVEEIRDGLLAIDGTLDYEMGGTLQEGFGTDGENSQDRLSVNPDKLKRRTVYVPLRRANLPSLLNLFDFGDATTTMGRRALTNVAPQALFMLNSEFLSERSANLAGQVLKETAAPAERMHQAYLRTVNRQPAAEEIDAALTYVANHQKKYPGDKAEPAAWQSLVRALMASNDFIYVD